MPTAPPNPDGMLRRPEVAERLRCSERTVSRLINRGEIPLFRPQRGREPALIEQRDVDDYLERERVKARRQATHRKKSTARRTA